MTNETIAAFQAIAPPLWVVDRLEQRQAQTGDVPSDVLAWVAEWQRIRGRHGSVVDGRIEEITEVIR